MELIGSSNWTAVSAFEHADLELPLKSHLL
jgi:hypothetical protein